MQGYVPSGISGSRSDQHSYRGVGDRQLVVLGVINTHIEVYPGYRRYVAVVLGVIIPPNTRLRVAPFVVLGVIIPPVRGIVVRMDWRYHLIGAMTLRNRTSGDQRTSIQYRCSS